MSRWSFLPLTALALLPALPAAAAPDDIKVDVEEWVEHNPPMLPITDGPRPAHLGAKIVFTNFDGANMNGGCGNKPQNNCSTIFTGTVLPYNGDKAARAGIVQVMREKLYDFGISVTSERPTSGDYDMEMVGPWQGGSPGGVGGIAPAGDCWDSAGGQVSFTMLSGGAESVADVIMQEIAHTWGLSHVDEVSDLLYPTTSGQPQGMQDGCYQIVSNTQLDPSSSGCSHHQQACGSNSQQNSYQELMLIFGPGTADSTAPVVSIITPTEGQVFASGETVDLLIHLEDEQVPMVIDTLIVVNSPALPEPVDSSAKYAAPSDYAFPLSGLPDGSYTVTLSGSDEEGNPANDAVVNFVVGKPSETTGTTATTDPTTAGTTSDTSGGTDGSGGSDSVTTTDGTASGSGGTATATAGTGLTGGDMSGDDGGCACTATPRGNAAWALLPMLVGFVRRRRD